jgi:hypothetical protein
MFDGNCMIYEEPEVVFFALVHHRHILLFAYSTLSASRSVPICGIVRRPSDEISNVVSMFI